RAHCTEIRPHLRWPPGRKLPHLPPAVEQSIQVSGAEDLGPSSLEARHAPTHLGQEPAIGEYLGGLLPPLERLIADEYGCGAPVPRDGDFLIAGLEVGHDPAETCLRFGQRTYSDDVLRVGLYSDHVSPRS